MTQVQHQRAETFQRLHTSGQVLVLLNAWDPGSARLCQGAGGLAIGTTSMGIAASLGLPDMEQVSLGRMLTAVTAIVDAVDVPVTADMEAGYGGTTDEIVASMRRAAQCGIAGINIEDSPGVAGAPLIEPSQMVERVSAIRELFEQLQLPIVINARADAFLFGAGKIDDPLAEAIARGNRYRQAGADCVFVPGGLDRDTIRDLVRNIDAPLNVVANPAISIPVVPTVPELHELGVARVSLGSGLMRAALAFVHRAAGEIIERGNYDTILQELQQPEAKRSYAVAIGQTRP